jgi:large subunit ribosomal protein L29
VKANDMRELTTPELHRQVEERQKDLVNFRLRVATGVVENVREARMKRREIARIKTVLRERELAASKGNK